MTTTSRNILVTGANKGIGLAVCRSLLEQHSDVHVYLGSRNVARGQAAVSRLQQELGASVCQNRLDLVAPLDVGSSKSVKAAAKRLQKAAEASDGAFSLYGIVNNAGIFSGGSMNETLDVNYWGVRRVTDAFGRLLASNGRIVNVASMLGPSFVAGLAVKDSLKRKLAEPWTIQGGIDELDEMVRTTQFSHADAMKVYGYTKALVAAYTYLYAKEHLGHIANSVEPGFIDTDLTKGWGARNTPEHGARPILYCLLSEKVASKPTGRLYGSDSKRSPLHINRGPGDREYRGPDGP